MLGIAWLANQEKLSNNIFIKKAGGCKLVLELGLLLFGLLSSAFCRASWDTIIPWRFFFSPPRLPWGDPHTRGRHWSSHRTTGLTSLLHTPCSLGF